MKVSILPTMAAALVLLLAGCRTLLGPSEASRALSASLAGRDVDEGTRQRVAQDEPLTLEDIKGLAKAGVADDLIIGQVEASRAVYRLATAQVLDLHQAGVSDAVIDYLLGTAMAVALPPRYAGYGWYYAFPGPYPLYAYPYPVPYPYHRPRPHGWH